MPQNELQHWGILGMKWGRRNGPPYPLGKGDMSKRAWQKLSPEEKAIREEGEKQHILRYGSADDVAIKLRGRLTNDEYVQVLARLNNEKKIADLQRETDDANWQKAEKTIQHVQTVNRGFNAAADTYNNIARVAYATGNELPLIPTTDRIYKVKDDISRDRRASIESQRKERAKEAETIRKEQRERERWLEDYAEGRINKDGKGSSLNTKEIEDIVNRLLDEREDDQ